MLRDKREKINKMYYNSFEYETGVGLFGQLIIAICIISFSIFLGYQCTSSRTKDLSRILEEQGYTEIKLLGYEVFGCGKGDTISEGFSAKNSLGHIVHGNVCCGMALKNCTIRYK